MIAAAFALGMLSATVALAIAWTVVLTWHLTADDRRYRKNLRRERKP